MKIFKYQFAIQDQFILKFSRKFEILSVQMQDDKPTVWIAVEPEADQAEHILYVRGTGQDMGIAWSAKYIGTFQMEQGALVFHLFYGGEKRQ